MRRSMLFVPGNNPKMMTSCGFFGADAVIFDLEDAVSPQEKDAARRLVHYALTNLVLGATESIVRVNSTDTAMFRPLDRLECEHGMEPGSIGVIALIETALGVENAYAIATASPRVRALFLGGEDLSADLRCKRTKESREIFYARTRLVMAARAAGVDVYDTPFTDVDDDEGLRADAEFAKSHGFTGKASISPRHLEGINACFSPTQAEADYAREVLEAIEEGVRQGKGAVALRGKMIDAPVVARARQTLEAAEEIIRRGGTLA